MTFYWPHAFWLLLIPFALFVRDLRRRRITTDTHPKITSAAVRHSSLVLDPSSFRRSGGPRIRILCYLALAAAAAALARPQWGRLEEPVYDQAREIIIALDLSRSMLAEDVKPSRLERARLLITSLLERLKGERVGLIVFSGTAFLQSPLSSDYEILREFLPALDPGYLPEGGTNYDALLETTLSAFGSSASADRFLVVLSDGEAQSDTWRKHLDDLKTKDIRILSLGIGTEAGSIIPDGQGAFVKDERGAVVLSRLDNRTLRELAEKTKGRYADASGWVDLSQLIQATVEQGRRGEFKETTRVRLAERYQWPLAAALGLFLLSFWRESPVRPKPRAITLSPPLKAAALTFGVFVCSLALGPSAFAAETSSASAPLTQIITHLADRAKPTAGDYAELARATVTFGERTRSAHETIPAGTVRDALAATAAGEALDPKSADWPGLREQLKALLTPGESPPPEKNQPKPDEKKPEQNKNQNSDNSGSKSGPSDQPKPDDPQPEAGKPEDQESKGGEGKSPDSSSADSPKKSAKPGQSAFGDMKDSAPPKPPEKADGTPGQPDGEKTDAPKPGDMQQVGGVAGDTSTDPAREDPNLTVPMQKLDQVKQGDSPARLFQLLQEPGTGQPAPTGKNW